MIEIVPGLWIDPVRIVALVRKEHDEDFGPCWWVYCDGDLRFRVDLDDEQQMMRALGLRHRDDAVVY